MRRLIILLAAALAGCSVELEGAACDVPGETAQCPSGQACGIDKRCSSKPKYECDPPGAEIAVDVEQSGKLGGGLTVTPTGAEEPPGCRLPTLAAALDAVVAGTTGIQIYAGTEETTYPFDAPLQIPDGFTVTSVSAGGEVVLQTNTPNVDLVILAPGGTLRNLTLESTTAGQAGDALTVACGAATKKATILGVKVKGAGKVRRGLTLTGSCGVDATDFVVTGARQDGVYVETDGTVTSTFTRGTLEKNGESGLVVWAGKVVAQGDGSQALEIHENEVYGVFVSARATATAPSDLTLKTSKLYANKEIGLVVLDSKRPGNTSAITLDRVELYKNVAATDLSAYAGRKAGGLLLQGELAPSFSMKGSLVCGNGFDEVGVYSTDDWNLSGDVCGTNGNTFAVPGAATDYLIYSTSSTPNVTAQNNHWVGPPSSRLNSVTYNPVCGGTAVVPTYCN